MTEGTVFCHLASPSETKNATDMPSRRPEGASLAYDAAMPPRKVHDDDSCRSGPNRRDEMNTPRTILLIRLAYLPR